MTEQELKEIYFGFYDQLNEPERSEAKENWSYEWAKNTEVPDKLTMAIFYGFNWTPTKQGSDYWDNIWLEQYPKHDISLKKDMVENPEHYGGKDNPYEVIKVLEAWGLNKRAYLWNAIKYIGRAGKKDKTKEIEDLKKSIFYIQKEIELLEKQ